MAFGEKILPSQIVQGNVAKEKAVNRAILAFLESLFTRRYKSGMLATLRILEISRRYREDALIREGSELIYTNL